MAKQYEVTLTKASTYVDMGTGKTWKKNQSASMSEAAAAPFKTNPRFTVRETEAKAAPKKAAAPVAKPAAEPETEPATEAPAKKKVAAKKKAT